jgi:hypothetical protein
MNSKVMNELCGLELSEQYVSHSGLTADRADKYHLYQLSVQGPGADIRFLYFLYRKLRNKRARHFREDFCGTALLTQTWINMSDSHTAEGFDNDSEPLEWGKKHNFEPLGVAANRAVLHLDDARARSIKQPDIRCAQNFSYWLLTERKALMEYFKSCQIDLAEAGLLYLDVYGGPLATNNSVEVHETDYAYSWFFEQCEYWPVTANATCKIHFKFDDGTELKNAFVYNWRVWTLPEMIDMLYEAGFSEVICYWSSDLGDEAEFEGYRPTVLGSNDPHWVAYIIALK